MGTSSSYPGPTGKPPLLPPWAEPAPDGDGMPPDPPVEPPPPQPLDRPPDLRPELIPVPKVSWRSPKARVRQVLSGGGSWGAVGRSYVRAHGDPRMAARAAREGKKATVRLGGFLAEGMRHGFAEAARRFGLQAFLGQGVDLLLARLVDLLAPAGNLLDEGAARRAEIETLAELFDTYGVDAGGVDALNAMTADGMRAAVTLSVVNFVNVRLQQELVYRIERSTVSEREANRIAAEAKDFIAGLVQLDLQDVNIVALDWEGPEGRAFVDRIYEDAYTLLGGEE